ncbi:TetR/AcrR family transcriptional regulator [Sporosarcina sp. 179-K 3D1 HS]|uniref:TetR/AcrR family transcriptional regulator n=1 Tax=Sporosarcina sp. 179-K 3D1 HS TaxID=3232169 RepID=UPI00399F700E
MNERKRQVLMTAQRLFVEKGFQTTSIQDILDAAKISKGTFYNYFASKNECLMAILEQAHIESTIRRRELLVGHDITDKTILAKQISVRLVVNREQHLMPLYEAVLYSGDEDLRAFIRKRHLTELRWLADRLVDVYGKEATPYANDGAVILIGIIQHYHHFCNGCKQDFDADKTISFCIRRLDSIMQGMMEADDHFIEGEIWRGLEQPVDDKSAIQQRLIEQFSGFLRHLTDESRQHEIQYTQFLLEEMKADHPRLFILETVARSFRETFNGTAHESEAHELISHLWKYIDLLKKDSQSS